MTEVVLFPEMLAAGIEALMESRSRRFADYDTVIAVYLAMEAIREITEMKEANETRH